MSWWSRVAVVVCLLFTVGASGGSSVTAQSDPAPAFIDVVFAELADSEDVGQVVRVPAIFDVEIRTADGTECRIKITDEMEIGALGDCSSVVDAPNDAVARLTPVAADGTVDEDTPSDALLSLQENTGDIVVDGDRLSIRFPPPSPGSILVAPIEFSAGQSSEIDGAARITVPRDCGYGFVGDGTFVLYVEAANPACTDRETFTVRFSAPNGPEYRIAAPPEGVVQRESITIDDDDSAISRGGAVTISTDDDQSWSAQRGLRLEFQSASEVCGSSDVNENSAYAVSLSPPCAPNGVADVGLVGSELSSSSDLGTSTVLPVDFRAPDGRRFVMGRAQADEAAIAEGETITISDSTDTQCGTTTVQRDGAYLLVLVESCSTTGSLRARLASGLTATAVLADDGSPVANLVFETPTEPPPAETATARPDALLAPGQVIFVLAFILVIATLAIVVKWNSSKQSRAIDRLIEAAAEHPGEYSIADIKELADLETPTSFRPAFELALLAMVTVALVTLTLGGTVTEQGVLTILGAIVGYAAGRSASPKG